MLKAKNKRKIAEDKVKTNGKEDTKGKVEKEPESDYESDQVRFVLNIHVVFFIDIVKFSF